MQLAALVERPDLLAIVGSQKIGGKLAEVVRQVGNVPIQHAAGVVVARCVDRLRQVDNDRPVAADEDVVLGQVAVDDPGAKHAHHLLN